MLSIIFDVYHLIE